MNHEGVFQRCLWIVKCILNTLRIELSTMFTILRKKCWNPKQSKAKLMYIEWFSDSYNRILNIQNWINRLHLKLRCTQIKINVRSYVRIAVYKRTIFIISFISNSILSGSQRIFLTLYMTLLIIFDADGCITFSMQDMQTQNELQNGFPQHQCLKKETIIWNMQFDDEITFLPQSVVLLGAVT